MLKNKIPPPIVTSVFAALIFFSTEWTPNIVFSGQNLISLFFMIAGLIVLLIAISAFIKFKTTINPLKPEQASLLVMTGIFKFSRNPMY
jgi:protein-S-isoprenylcysteine O-methyltransferase Ste14